MLTDKELAEYIAYKSSWYVMLHETGEAPQASPFEVGMRIGEIGETIAFLSFIPSMVRYVAGNSRMSAVCVFTSIHTLWDEETMI